MVREMEEKKCKYPAIFRISLQNTSTSDQFQETHLRHMQASVSNFILLLIYLTYSLSLRLKTCVFLKIRKIDFSL